MKGWAKVVLGAGLALGLAGPSVAQAARLLLSGGQDVVLPAGAVSGVSDMAAPGLVLTLTELQDQRCPSTVDCYWEGMIRAVISVNPGANDARTFVLCNLCDDGDRDAVVAGYLLTLDHLEPAVPVIEQLDRAAVLADYSVTVIVSAAP